MLKKTLLTLTMCLAVSATAMAAVTEKVENGAKYRLTYPEFSFTNQTAELKANKFVAQKVADTVGLLWTQDASEVATQYKLIRETDEYVNITLTTYSYSGGAHGMYTTYGLVFDKETGSCLPYTDFAAKISKKDLKKDILNGKLKVYTADLKTESGAPFLKDYSDFKVSDNYIIGDDGHVYLMYQPYELDAYAAGVTYVQLPKKA